MSLTAINMYSLVLKVSCEHVDDVPFYIKFCTISLLGQEPPKPLRFLERVEKPVPRPPTPTVQCPPAGLEETEQAVVLLQRIIRGRAIQNKVYDNP